MIRKKLLVLVTILLLITMAGMTMACKPKDKDPDVNDPPPGPPEVKVQSVSLNQSTLNLVVNADPVSLTATVLPDNATNKGVTWSSSNPTVATAANGSVRPIGAGTATITVTTLDGGKTATCAVTVTEVAVTSMTLSKSSATIAAAAQDTVTATLQPANATNKSVTWVSDTPAVAVVYGGVITGLSAGTAVITATSASGGFTQTVNVTVTAITVDLTGFTAIGTVAQYLAFVENAQANVNGKFYLTADLDFEGANVKAFGTRSTGDPRAFTGTFDGRGYAIKNATFISDKLSSDSGDNAVGSNLMENVAMFSRLTGGTVKNLSIINCTFRGHLWVAAIAGQASGGSTIENCYIQATVHNQHIWYDPWCWGGIVTSINNGSTVRNVVIDSVGIHYTTGTVAVNQGGTVRNVYVHDHPDWASIELTITENPNITPAPLIDSKLVSTADFTKVSTFDKLNPYYWNLVEGEKPALRQLPTA